MRLRLLTIFGLLLAMGQGCFASNYNYKIWLWTQSSPATGSFAAITADPEASKGHQWGENIWPDNPSPTGVLLGFYNVEGTNGWDTTTGWYDATLRESVSASHSVVVDNLYLWASPGTPSQNLQLQINYLVMDPNIAYKLTLISAPASYTGQKVWGTGDTTITLPFYSTSDGRNGYRFRADFLAVPEPSSILAFSGWAIGLAGLALRRRRR